MSADRRRSWSSALSGSSSLERFYAHLILGNYASEGPALIEEIFRRVELPPETKSHLRAVNPERLVIYRQLTRATYRKAIVGAMPRAVARMGATFDTLFSEFLAERATSSRFLRDITWDFLDDAPHRSEARTLPSYIWELGTLEAVRIVIAAARDPKEPSDLELDLNRGLLFAEASHLLRFGHAVHRLPLDEEDRTPPEEVPTQILVYRSPENQVRYLDLSPLAAQIVEELTSGNALGRAVQEACNKMGQPLTDSILKGTAELLSDLAERGVLLGVSEVGAIPAHP